MISIPKKTDIITSLSEENKKSIITTISKQINIKTSLPEQKDEITTIPKENNEMTSKPEQNKKDIITTISNKSNILTTVSKKENTKTTLPNQTNGMITIPEQKSTIITVLEANNAVTTLPKKNIDLTTVSKQYDIRSTFPKQNDEVTTIPKIKGSMESIPMQSDVMITTSQLNKIESIPEQKETLKIGITVPTSKDSLPSLINLTIINNTEKIAQGNFDTIGKPVIILLGFSNIVFDKNHSLISFYIYFVPVKNYLHSQRVRFFINIHYISLLRFLQNKEAVCTLKNIHQSNQNKYLCIVQAETLKIKSIESNPEFIF